MTSTPSAPATAATCLACGSELRDRWLPTAWHMPDREREFGYFTCPSCGSIGCAPLPTDEELGHYYARHFNYDWYVRHFRLKKIQAWHRWRRMQRVFAEFQMQPGRMLDIGCGHGHFLQQARRDGWDVVGVDYLSNAK